MPRHHEKSWFLNIMTSYTISHMGKNSEPSNFVTVGCPARWSEGRCHPPFQSEMRAYSHRVLQKEALCNLRLYTSPCYFVSTFQAMTDLKGRQLRDEMRYTWIPWVLETLSTMKLCAGCADPRGFQWRHHDTGSTQAGTWFGGSWGFTVASRDGAICIPLTNAIIMQEHY